MQTSENKTPDYNYDAVMSVKSGKFCFYIQELQILGCGDSINSAYNDLINKKEALLKEFQESANLAELPNPDRGKSSIFGSGTHEIKVFLMKLLIIVLISGITLPFALSFLEEAASKFTNPLAQGLKEKMRLKNFANFILVQLDDAVQTKIPPDQEKRIVEAIRILAKKFKPYAIEIQKIWNSSQIDLKEASGKKDALKKLEKP